MNGEAQYYTYRRIENSRIGDTTLIIEARNEDYLGASYTSARIISRYNGDWLYGRIEARAKCTCARCLEPFPLTLASQFQISLKPKPDFAPAEEVELSREDLETDFYEGEEIDLSPHIQDQVLLTLPPKVVCREDCRGLCQGCGRNLNREECRCPERALDPRLEVLKNYRVH